MTPIKVMVNGIPGKVAVNVAAHILADPRFELVKWSLTGPEITDAAHRVNSVSIGLIRPEAREKQIRTLKERQGAFIAVDFTHPTAVNGNAEFYCDHGLAFVMGTTGGDRQRLADTVTRSAVSAVIAPNMAKQIVGFQAMMEYAAQQFPGLFAGYRLAVRESHQRAKADTSGTAKAVVACFNRLGIPFTEDQIQKERDPQIQKTAWGIPEAHLNGHGWHTYTLCSPDGSALFSFTHNINGRDIYALGTMDAVAFLAKKTAEEIKGKVFSMIDVLKGK
jgi:4-hydroxy-tetrahydrodipicolinate reductase